MPPASTLTTVCSHHQFTCGRSEAQAIREVHTCKLQVPAGSLPRTMDVILRNDIVEAVRAGDKVGSAARIAAGCDGRARRGLMPDPALLGMLPCGHCTEPLWVPFAPGGVHRQPDRGAGHLHRDGARRAHHHQVW